MPDKQKLIGVCLSQAHTFLNTGFLTELNRAAAGEGYAMAVFNSSLDFYWYQKANDAPRSIYKSIRFDLFDAIIIIYHSFHDDALVSEIVENARRSNVPVICAGAELPGCWSILNDYEEGYKALIRHVVRDHNAQDTFFIAGMKNEPNSEARLRCYREVLEECGLPFSEDQVAYGNYWDKPARAIARNLVKKRDKVPQAILCANDVMAIAVCDALHEEGLRVPEDVIVTGFDGSPAAYMVHPHLTTCSDDPKTLAEQTVKLIGQIRAGEDPPRVLTQSFKPVFSGSCGCPQPQDDRYDALTVYRRSEALNNHENDLYHKVEQMLMQKDPEDFLKVLSQSILPSSVVYLNERFLEVYSGMDFSPDLLEENLLAVSYRDREEGFTVQRCKLSDLRPATNARGGMTVFNAIHTGFVTCGFFSAYTTDLENDAQLIKRISDVLNLVFAIQLGDARQKTLIRHLDNTLYTDSTTGFTNRKGLTRWFEQYSSDPNHHERALALSVYGVPRYSYIYESYGMNETDEVIRLIGNKLTAANPNALNISRISEDQFAVINEAANSGAIGDVISRSTADFFRQIEAYNAASAKQYYIEVNCGCTVMENGWSETSPENLVRLALGEMYLNRLREGPHKADKDMQITAGLYSSFSLLMEKNLFRYHFQPIVDAKTGQIYAYEALMRTDTLINLTPLQILAIAREYNRLDDVERITVFGIMERYIRSYGDFRGCKVFINTIPGHFLSQQDCADLISRYESYLDCFVFELTEQDSISEEELLRLKKLCKSGSQAQLAIDDYGTGHSNMVNVLRYAPQIIKIDRELIADIQSDSNKQLFVRNTIDFAHQNGIRALAEGVETSEELRAVIDYGVDLIQGFYTGRPSEQPIPALSENIRNEIVEENLRLIRFDQNTRVYTARDGETVNVFDLALHRYSYVLVTGGNVTLTGQEKNSVDMVIRIEDNAAAVLTLDHVNIRGVNETTIQLGNNCELTLVLKGRNTLNKEGVMVPPSSCLIIRGDGDLQLNNNRNYSVGLGANFNDPYGTIVIDVSGRINVQSSGDKVVCIGGGRSAGEGIHLRGGTFHLSANGINSVGIGSTIGKADIQIGNVFLSAHLEGNDVVAVGTISGQVALTSSGQLRIVTESERATALGSLSGTGEISFEGGSVSVTTRCDAGACVGTLSGELTSRIRDTVFRIHGEGNRVAGFGSLTGACDTRIESGDVQGEVLAGDRYLLGNENSRVVITGGNIRLFPEEHRTPLSPGGLVLHYREPEGNHYEHDFKDRRASWTYIADRNSDGNLGVWIPFD